MKILLVDDHPLVHEALRHLLPRFEQSIDLLRAETGLEARRALITHPDLGLIMLDLTLPDESGVTLLEALRATAPSVPVVILSASVDRDLVRRCIAAGAMGYLPKSARAEVMINALEHVLDGGVYLPPEATHLSQHQLTTTRRRASDIGLTERQSQVLALLVKGKPTKVICRELNIAEGTAKIHIASIFRSLKVANRTEAVYAASQLGLVFEQAFSRV